MESFFEYAPCFYFSCKDDGSIIEVNDTICTKLGYTRQELIDKKQENIFNVATRIFQQTHLLPLLKIKGNADEIFITLLSKNKEEVAVLFNIVRINVKDEWSTIYTGIRISHRKEYEDRLISDKKTAESALLDNTALKKAKTELLERAGQLDVQVQLVKKQTEELKQFNKVVTHDLQEPLRKLSMFSHLLSKNEEPKGIQKIVDKMIHAAKRLEAVVAGLQHYIWLSETPLQRTELDLNELVAEAKRKLERETTDIVFDLEQEELPVIPGDRKQIELLIYHLLSNVVRYRKPGHEAKAKFSSKLLQLNKLQNTEGRYHYQDYVKLQLKDEGIGFDPAYKEQVFDLFKHLHSNSGQGVGLSLSKKIIENHEGSISVNTEPGKGTTITVLLPAG